MNKLNFPGPGVAFGATQNRLNFMQQSFLSGLNAIAGIGGNDWIISGCNISFSEGHFFCSDGWLVKDGEILPFFVGQFFSDFSVYIVEVAGAVEAERIRKVVIGTGADYFEINQLPRCAMIQRGMIMLWTGSIATIPSEWNLCDGTNNTPDLRDKFIVGAKQDSSARATTNIEGTLKQTGGSVNIVLEAVNLPQHTHSVPSSIDDNAEQYTPGGTITAGNNNGEETTGVGNGLTDPPTPVKFVPPYYALAYIMKL